MPGIDTDALLKDITSVATDILQKDVKQLSGYSETKARNIAQFTKQVGDAYANGVIGEDDLKLEMQEAERMAERFVRNMEAMAHVAVEQLIKGITGALWNAVRGAASAAGVALPSLGA